MNFILRPWTIEDLDNLVKFANNYNIAKNLTDAFPHPYFGSDQQNIDGKIECN